MPTTFTNQATFSYNNQSIPSNVVTGVLTEVLSVSKTAIPAAYQNGDTITYAVQLVNSGTAALTGLTLTDNLGAYTPAAAAVAVVPMTYQSDTLRYYRNGILQATPTVAATSPLTVTGLSIPAGGNTTLMYAVKTNQFTPYGAEESVTNTATVTGGGLAAPLTAEATVNADPAPDLSVIKSMCPTTVTEAGALTYTGNDGDGQRVADGYVHACADNHKRDAGRHGTDCRHGLHLRRCDLPHADAAADSRRHLHPQCDDGRSDNYARHGNACRHGYGLIIACPVCSRGSGIFPLLTGNGKTAYNQSSITEKRSRNHEEKVSAGMFALLFAVWSCAGRRADDGDGAV